MTPSLNSSELFQTNKRDFFLNQQLFAAKNPFLAPNSINAVFHFCTLNICYLARRRQILYQSKRITNFLLKIFSPRYCAFNDKKRKISLKHSAKMTTMSPSEEAEEESKASELDYARNRTHFISLSRGSSKHVCRKINIFSLWCLIVSVLCFFNIHFPRTTFCLRSNNREIHFTRHFPFTFLLLFHILLYNERAPFLFLLY